MGRQSFNKNPRVPRPTAVNQEFGPGKKGIIVCKTCNAAYYKKSWHHNLEQFKGSEKKDTGLIFKTCPACDMIAKHQYEGRLQIFNIPSQHAEELSHCIKNLSDKLLQSDPMDRLIAIVRKTPSEWVVTTTENQMANKIAHKIKKTFRNVNTRTKFGKDPNDTVEIMIEFSQIG